AVGRGWQSRGQRLDVSGWGCGDNRLLRLDLRWSGDPDRVSSLCGAALHWGRVCPVVRAHPQTFPLVARIADQFVAVGWVEHLRNPSPYQRTLGWVSQVLNPSYAPHRSDGGTHTVLRSNSSIEIPCGPRMKQIRTPGRTVVGSLVNSTPLPLSSAATASMPLTVSPK